MKIIVSFTGNKFVKKYLLKNAIRGLFFNTIISLILEGLLEFIVYSALNLFTKDFTLSGEILGFIILLFCLFCAFIFIPTASLWAIFTKDEKKFSYKLFKKRWGALFEFLKKNKKMVTIYNIVNIARRLSYVTICFLLIKTKD